MWACRRAYGNPREASSARWGEACVRWERDRTEPNRTELCVRAREGGGRGGGAQLAEPSRTAGLPQEYLKEALDIFDGAGLNGLRCDTLNSMGTLKQSRGRLRRGASPRKPDPHPGGGQRRIGPLGSLGQAQGMPPRLGAQPTPLSRPRRRVPSRPCAGLKTGRIHLHPPGSTWIHSTCTLCPLDVSPQEPYALSAWIHGNRNLYLIEPSPTLTNPHQPSSTLINQRC